MIADRNRLVRLGDLLRLRKDVVHPRDKPSGRATFVGLEHIESGTGRRTGGIQLDLAALTGRKPRFCADDVVYGYLRPYLNKVWLAEFEGLCSVDQYVYEVDRTLAHPAFVAWFMRSPSYFDRAPSGLAPGQLPRIRLDEVAAVSLALPTLESQLRIGQKIEDQMTAVARSRAAAKAVEVSLRAIVSACLMKTFDGWERRRWPTRRLSDLVRILPSRSIATGGDADVHAVTTACLTETGFVSTGLKRARMRSVDVPAATIQPGEVLVARSNTRELVGRASAFWGMDIPVVASDLTFRLAPDPGLHADFLAQFLAYRFASGYWRDRAGGASGSMKKITRTQLLGEAVPVPSRVAQEHMVARLTAQLFMAISAQGGAVATTNAIDALPAALLKHAFREV